MHKHFLDELFENREITEDMLYRYKLGKYRRPDRESERIAKAIYDLIDDLEL